MKLTAIVGALSLSVLITPLYGATKGDRPEFHSRQTDNETIHDFKLDEAFLEKIMRIQSKIADLPDEPDQPGLANDTSILGLSTAVESKPKLRQLIQSQGLNARDYIIGSLALRASFINLIYQQNNDAIAPELKVSRHNLNFAKKHEAAIRTIFRNAPL